MAEWDEGRPLANTIEFKQGFTLVFRLYYLFGPSSNLLIDYKDSRGPGFEDPREMHKNYNK
jgi:hypothetical protein